MSEQVTDAYRRLEQSELDWMSWEEKEQFYGELKDYAQEKGYKPGFASMKYRTRFGEYPNDHHVRNAPARPCGPETRLWVKATQDGFWRTKRRG